MMDSPPADVEAEPQFPLVSIVIPMRNEESHIAECLESLLRQDYPASRVETLVVDGMSEDRSREIVGEFVSRNPNIELLDNPKAIVPTAMNIGIQRAKGNVIVRVDGHCRLEDDHLTQCVKYLQSTKADNVGGMMRATGKNFVGEAIALVMSSPFGMGNSRFHYSDREEYVDTVYLGAYPRAVFDRIGLLDERLVRNEDYEFNYRLRRSGGRIFYTPAIKVHYYCRDSLVGLLKQYSQYGFWKARVIKKHPRSIAPRHLVPPILVAVLMTTGLLGLASHHLRYLFAPVVVVYSIALLIASILIAGRKGWRYLPILPLTFACLHLAWGSGVLWGLLRVISTCNRDRGEG